MALLGAGGTELQIRGEQPGKALAALVCAGGGMGGAGISRLLTPASVTLTIPAIFGCFWWSFGTHSLPPEMPGTGAGQLWLLRCVLWGTAHGGHGSPLGNALFFFPSEVPIILWDVWGLWFSSQCFGGASCCPVLFAVWPCPELEAWRCWAQCRDEGTLLPKQLPVSRLKWLRHDKASQSKKLRLFFWLTDGERAWS